MSRPPSAVADQPGATPGRHRMARVRWLTALVILGVCSLQVAVMTADAATRPDRVRTVPAEVRTEVSAAVASATTTTTTTTTVPPSPPTPAISATTTTDAPPTPAPAPPPAAAHAPAGGCAEALAYLAAHQGPGFMDVCGPGTAFARYGVTCWNRAPMCPNDQRFIHIACPLPFVYMNEAHNSWTLLGQGSGIDPYGQGNAAERQYCDRLR